MNGKTTNRKTARKAGAMSIETILLLIVAIVAVGIAFLFYMGYIGSAAVNPKAAVQQFDITVASDGSAAIALVIKNTGNVRITDARILGWTGVSNPNIDWDEGGAQGLPADPGKTIFFSGTAAANTFVLGQQYGVRVQITYANGATEVLTAQATAHP
jgi:nitrogen fixation protein FixH